MPLEPHFLHPSPLPLPLLHFVHVPFRVPSPEQLTHALLSEAIPDPLHFRHFVHFPFATFTWAPLHPGQVMLCRQFDEKLRRVLSSMHHRQY